jgi:hypothetical protein
VTIGLFLRRHLGFKHYKILKPKNDNVVNLLHCHRYKENDVFIDVPSDVFAKIFSAITIAEFFTTVSPSEKWYIKDPQCSNPLPVFIASISNENEFLTHRKF